MNSNKAKALDELVREHIMSKDETGEINRWITLATHDLMFGPIGPEDDDGKPWPGFEKACEAITDFLDDTGTLYVDSDCDYVTDSEPDWDDEEIDSSVWYEFSKRDIARAVCGQHLAGYV